MDDELEFSGIGISPKVFETVVRKAAEDVEGVATVGVPSQSTATLFSLLSSSRPVQLPSVGVRPDEESAKLAVHVTAFFGYPFLKLAEDVRSSVATAVEGLIGTPVKSVDVFIDAIVFPKE